MNAEATSHTPAPALTQPALAVEQLSVRFRTARGDVQALTDASFEVAPGEVLVVIGESGSGKTVLAHAIMRLLPLNVTLGGSVRLGETELLGLSEREMQRVRGRRIALIPQGAGSALNPVRRIGSLLLEMATARGLSEERARSELTTVLAELDLDFDRIAHRYPHQLSGGMQQRVVNALAMVGSPDLVLADEPTHGLDPELVDVVAEQLAAIAGSGSALLVITHDLRLAERLGGRLGLIYASYLVELRGTGDFFKQPAHPYGRALLEALPERGGRPIPGVSPELTALPAACAFAPRCREHLERCDAEVPPPYTLPGEAGAVRCFLHAQS